MTIAATSGMQIFHATGIAFSNGSSVTASSGAGVTIDDADVSGVATTTY